MSNGRKDIPFATRRQLVLCTALACFNIAFYGVVSAFTEINSAILATAIVVLYLCEVAIVDAHREKHRKFVSNAGIYGLLEEKGSVYIKNSHEPFAAFDKSGTMLWCNDSMLELLDLDESPLGKNLSVLFTEGFNWEEIGVSSMEMRGRLYNVESFIIEGEEPIYLLSMQDVTALRNAEKKYNDSRVCVAYIAIDNVEDILQYVHEKFRVAVSSVDEKLKAWADSMNASIKSYDSDKYIMFFDSLSLDKCVANRFDILDEIRDTRVGDGVSVTVSIGVSRMEGSLRDRELAARDAIDLALQRGGDQVVYVNDGVTEFYGGKTKSVYKRSNVRSRTFANQLQALMARADNVIVMGHRYGDFDSFGASVGIARLAMLCGVKVNIAVELREKNLAPCIRMMETNDDFSQIFVDNADGLDLVGPDTLVILVDHNNPSRAQFNDIAAKVKNLVIIDHHRKIDAMHESVRIHYIEPAASSACEIVTEMLESAVSSQNLSKEEADMLLAGILLDTKQFTRNTGTRTFGAAQYLRGAGADPADVYSMFHTDPEDLSKEARFHTAITIFRGNIAISCCEGDTDDSYRIIASKAADKMLTLRGVEAAFTLVRIGELIHISGRSNGTINVQLILEKLNGGGHFDVAGAQVESDSVMNVLDTLKASIEDYLDS